LFDFLGTDDPRREAELEQKLISHLEKFLLELGQGFAFVGRQVHMEVGNQDFYIDYSDLKIIPILSYRQRKS
jgi:predicted nuclease of restriction endonuclease-like (RecB) superfamily